MSLLAYWFKIPSLVWFADLPFGLLIPSLLGGLWLCLLLDGLQMSLLCVNLSFRVLICRLVVDLCSLLFPSLKTAVASVFFLLDLIYRFRLRFFLLDSFLRCRLTWFLFSHAYKYLLFRYRKTASFLRLSLWGGVFDPPSYSPRKQEKARPSGPVFLWLTS